jgi:hypothetical protein
MKHFVFLSQQLLNYWELGRNLDMLDFQYRAFKYTAMVPVASHVNPIHILSSYSNYYHSIYD